MGLFSIYTCPLMFFELYVFSFLTKTPMPLKVLLSVCHTVFVKGDATNFELNILLVLSLLSSI